MDQNSRKNIEGKVVVITGASSGLCAATARYLASLGASVVLGARRVDKLKSIVDEIKSAGGSAIYLEVDVTKKSRIRISTIGC